MPSEQPRPPGRPALDPESRTTMISLRIPADELERLDKARGSVKRGEWVRAAIRAALACAKPRP